MKIKYTLLYSLVPQTESPKPYPISDPNGYNLLTPFSNIFQRKLGCFSQEPNPGAVWWIGERLEWFWFRALVHSEILLDRSRSRFPFFKHLRRLGTRYRGDIHNSTFPFALIFAAYSVPEVMFFEYLREIVQQGFTTTRNTNLKRYFPSLKKISGFMPKHINRADRCWAVKQALRSSFNMWCEVGLAQALIPHFRCVWRPAKLSLLQTQTLFSFWNLRLQC